MKFKPNNKCTVRKNISVPLPLSREMEELKHLGITINWSKIASEAFRNVVLRIKSGKTADKTAEERIAELELKISKLEGKK